MKKTPRTNRIIHAIRAGLLLALVSACSLPIAQAADQKYASVDLNKVFISLPATKKAEAEMNKLRATAREELNRKNAEIADAVKADNPKASEMKKQTADWTKRSEKELQEKFHDLRKPILESILTAVRTIQSKEGYTYVLDTSAILPSGAPVIFSSKDANDITEKVLSEASKSTVGSTDSSPRSTTSGAKVPVEITSEGPSEFKDGIAYASDDVVIKYMGMQIKADRIEYDPESRNVRFYGQENKDSEWKLIASLKFES